VAMYPKNQFPARLVYGSRGYAALQLVTCGGAFDTSTRSYLSNVVVYTSLVATTSAAAGPAQANGVLKKSGRTHSLMAAMWTVASQRIASLS
jgi:hypothetical protein